MAATEWSCQDLTKDGAILLMPTYATASTVKIKKLSLYSAADFQESLKILMKN